MDLEEPKRRERYSVCHICKVGYPVESVTMLCHSEDKTWEDDGEFWYLLIDGNYIRTMLRCEPIESE